ncbi:exopolysaccharide biosynthesis polyprenyl glycosylphosphotransferase [Lutimonas sp.]|uniref:exopolysaccharide biosynthesis polyprenyl glycosylphosphotransferase n=1 Tax=Lutimonas sp. TaxID=1872403 RepID=UPI003D9B487C
MLNSVHKIQENTKRTISLPQLGLWHKKTLLAFVDMSLLFLCLLYFHRAATPHLEIYEFIQNYNLNLFAAVGFFWILTIIFNFYDLDYVNKTRKVLPLSFFIGIIFTFTYFLTAAIGLNTIISNSNLFIFIFGFTSLLIIWRIIYASVIHSNVFAKKCIILSGIENDQTSINEVSRALVGNEFEYGLKVVSNYKVSADQKQIDSLSRAVERIVDKKLIDTIIIMDKDQESISNALNTSLVKAIGNGVQVKTYFKLYEEVKEAIPVQFAGNQLYTILPISKYNNNYVYLLWHKAIDIISSFLGLFTMLVLSPLILFMNLFFNKGPLFYKQKRVGKGGEEIEIVKFRSMIVEAEKDGAKMTIKGDKRVTQFGKIIRKLRIDELPQFWSVLKGDMSLIGPRPEQKTFINELVKSIPLYDSRHLIKPGITGWAQVKYEYGSSIEDSLKKLEYDLYYIKNRSITLDIRIIFKTINTIVFYKGE